VTAIGQARGKTPPGAAEAAGGAGLADAFSSLAAEPLAARSSGPDLVAASLPIEPFDAVSLYAAAVEVGLEATLWQRPGEGFALVGIGRAWAVEPSGPERFGQADEAWRSLLAGARIVGPKGERGLGPVLIGGLGFSGRIPAGDDIWAPFGASSLVVPALIALATPSASWLTGAAMCVRDSVASAAAELEAIWAAVTAGAVELATEATPGATPGPAPLEIVAETPSPAHWRHVVGLMAGAVGRGRLDKVVFARRADVASTAALDIGGALRRLAASAPEGAIYAFGRGGGTFLGATPERLIRTEGRTYRTAAIAGSIRRGRDAAEDAALRAELLASEKEREEHAVVVRTIRRQLAPLSERMSVAGEPEVMVLRHVQHLATPIEGTVRGNESLLALAGRLHPTPAVGGEPREPALKMIDEYEGFERGWYAGPVGWLSPDGDGEFMVALRCGLVRGHAASLFAGCGIVADSDPDREWEESRIKMRAVAAALGGPGDVP
jgi:isochorismate synthase